MSKELNRHIENNDIWINPTGGFGDILMLSGVLKHCHQINPNRKFSLVRRSIYTDLLKGHPCIDLIGYPPIDAKIILTDYWAKEKLGSVNQRAYQIIARMFGLETPIDEVLFIPGEIEEDQILSEFIPFKQKKIAVIAPSSASPRKMLDPKNWENIVNKLIDQDIFVIQVGRKHDTYIKGCYSLLGLTDPRQLISLLYKSDVLISVDNFVMHAAHLAGIPAVVIWGPTKAEVYGYPEQYHFAGSIQHCSFRNKCLGYNYPENYNKPCPLIDEHCMNKIPLDKIVEKILNICLDIKKVV